jgi:hypothetical protein
MLFPPPVSDPLPSTMPRTGFKSSDALALEIDNYQSLYCPGDTISGRVVRIAHIVHPSAYLNVALYGRAKSKITTHTQHGTYIYRGRFNFFTPTQLVETLFQGPIHIPANTEPKAWPFKIKIPSNPSPAAVMEENLECDSYLSLAEENIKKAPLPATFYNTGEVPGTRFEGYVEYYVQAQLVELENRKVMSEASFPIFLRERGGDTLLYDVSLNKRRFTGTFKTYRLLPGMEDAKLSIVQKSKSFLRSSKIPQLSFSLRVECPETIQLDSPNHLPFMICIIPDHEQTNEEIMTNRPKFKLTFFHLDLQAITAVACAGPIAHESTKDKVMYDFGLDSTYAPESGEPIGLPYSISHTDDEHLLDIGAILQLRVQSNGVSVLGKCVSESTARIHAGFTTFNISHGHRLRWGLTVSVAGESMSANGLQDVVLMAPSEECRVRRISELGDEGTKRNYDNLVTALELGSAAVGSTMNILEGAASL